VKYRVPVSGVTVTVAVPCALVHAEALVSRTESVSDPAAPAVKAIVLVPCPAVIVPFAIAHA
jgi:hypothetical protein